MNSVKFCVPANCSAWSEAKGEVCFRPTIWSAARNAARTAALGPPRIADPPPGAAIGGGSRETPKSDVFGRHKVVCREAGSPPRGSARRGWVERAEVGCASAHRGSRFRAMRCAVSAHPTGPENPNLPIDTPRQPCYIARVAWPRIRSGARVTFEPGTSGALYPRCA